MDVGKRCMGTLYYIGNIPVSLKLLQNEKFI